MTETRTDFHDHLAASEHGRFVLVSSSQAQKPDGTNAAYAATKAAAESWTLALADSSGGARQLALPDDPAPAASSLRARHVRWLSVRVADVYPGVPPSGTVALAEIELFRLG